MHTKSHVPVHYILYITIHNSSSQLWAVLRASRLDTALCLCPSMYCWRLMWDLVMHT